MGLRLDQVRGGFGGSTRRAHSRGSASPVPFLVLCHLLDPTPFPRPASPALSPAEGGGRAGTNRVRREGGGLFE